MDSRHLNAELQALRDASANRDTIVLAQMLVMLAQKLDHLEDRLAAVDDQLARLQR